VKAYSWGSLRLYQGEVGGITVQEQVLLTTGQLQLDSTAVVTVVAGGSREVEIQSGSNVWVKGGATLAASGGDLEVGVAGGSVVEVTVGAVFAPKWLRVNGVSVVTLFDGDWITHSEGEPSEWRWL
jgi:hypothetical protein